MNESTGIVLIETEMEMKWSVKLRWIGDLGQTHISTYLITITLHLNHDVNCHFVTHL